MGLFSKTQRKLVGIDISSAAVKLVELSRSDSGSRRAYRVEACASDMLPPGAVDARKIKQTDAVSEVVRALLRRSGSAAQHAAVAVSGAAVISRVLKLPAGLGEYDMESMVELEADRYLPQRIDEVRYDFDLLGPTAGSDETVDVLLVASRGDVVDDLIHVIESAGLVAGIVDAEQYAVEHVYQELFRQDLAGEGFDTVAVIDIGTDTMNVHLFSDGDLRQTREYHIGGQQLTRDISDAWGLEPGEAEARKCSGGLPDDYPETLLQPYVRRLSQDIRGAVQIFQTSDGGAPVELILLTGGSAGLAGITALLEQQIGIPVRVLDPFASMQFGRNLDPDKLREQAPAFTVACGLALRRFD